jgi:hypothetical protein
MYLSKLILSLILLISGFAFAQEEEEQAEPVSILNEDSLQTTSKARAVTFTYMSWMELVDVDNGAIVDNTKHATFFGAGIGYEQEKFNKRFGWLGEASYIFGQSHIGETSGAISYQKNYVKWMGASASARFAYRLGAPVTVSAGPIVVARQITWPDLPANTDVKSGADLNLGAIVEAKVLLNPNWELKQSIGTLAFKAATYWSLGLGYRY